MKMIYLDNGATTMLDPKVVKTMEPYFNLKYGNASSTHALGREAKMALNDARHVIAKSIKAKDEEIIFTSGGTESNNLAIKGLAFNRGNGHIITTKIEHDCVLNSCKWLEKRGFSVTYLDVDKEGFISVDSLKNAIREDTFLFSVIHGNNEIGTIQNLKELAKVCHDHGVLIHTDACQSYTKTELNVKKQGLDLVTLNAHKIHGPKGVGALYVRHGVKLEPLAHGGGHERGLRNGTENVPGIVGFAMAVKLAMKGKHVRSMTKLRDELISGILKIPGVRLNGPRKERLCNNVNVSFKNIEGEAIGGYLDVNGICSSTGSACSSHSLEASHVLKAIGLSDIDAHGSLRLTLSRFTTEAEIRKCLEVLPGIISKLRKMSPYKGGL